MASAEQPWGVRWEAEGDDSMTAVICECYGKGLYYDIAEITNVPCELDEGGDPTPIRRVGEDQRLREVVMIVSAADTLSRIKGVIEGLEELTGLNGKYPEEKWQDIGKIWQRLVSLQSMLEGAVELAEDTERV